jgi:hypothetical protein
MSFLEYFEPLPLPQLFFATLVCVAMVGAVVILIVRLAVRLVGLDTSQPILIRDAVISSLSAIFALMVAGTTPFRHAPRSRGRPMPSRT